MLCSVCGFNSKYGVLYGWRLVDGWKMFVCEECIKNPHIFLNFKRYKLPKLPPLQLQLIGAMINNVPSKYMP